MDTLTVEALLRRHPHLIIGNSSAPPEAAPVGGRGVEEGIDFRTVERRTLRKAGFIPLPTHQFYCPVDVHSSEMFNFSTCLLKVTG